MESGCRVSAPASANTINVQAGNNSRPGTTSMARAGSSGQRNPSNANSTAAVIASSSHNAGGHSITPKPSASDSSAVTSAQRQRGSVQALRN